MTTEIEAQIATLQSVLEAQKQRYRNHGPWLITIGVLWLGAFMVDIALGLAHVSSWYQILPWLLLTAVAFGLKGRVRDPGGQGIAVHWHDRVVKGVWLALVIGMWATVAVGSSGRLPDVIVLPLLEWWAAIGMIVSGLLFSARWFSRAGMLWFIGGVASFYLPQMGKVIVYPSLIIVAFIAPAVWLTVTKHRIDA